MNEGASLRRSWPKQVLATFAFLGGLVALLFAMMTFLASHRLPHPAPTPPPKYCQASGGVASQGYLMKDPNGNLVVCDRGNWIPWVDKRNTKKGTETAPRQNVN